MSVLFCCEAIQPFRPKRLTHEEKFSSFTRWANFPKASSTATTGGENDQVSLDLAELKPPYAVQLVRQINYGPLESKRYFIPVEGKDEAFVEVSEEDLVNANFQKLNSYKNFRCEAHNRFFELNLYQKDPVNLHHWRANLARPADSIDL
ncbi:hypothetical protein CC80DRAFT_530864 [Byssothecium circinans]|uniref:Uncharacterized protein n=1 Tax=Byssothecium circinans TaxID=147558 RepID=A0A6A5UJ90_9PLEO|nr:hypothetical protein CC80DRAFT_530864 [Byssothecium circinans]